MAGGQRYHGATRLERRGKTRNGRPLRRGPAGEGSLDAGYRWPQFSIHRGTLQMLLLEAVRARLGADAVRTDRRLVAFEDDGRRVRATFEDRTGTRHQDEADVLIGADGIHSAVRRAFYAEEGPPIW